jgi:hypothetical protein
MINKPELFLLMEENTFPTGKKSKNIIKNNHHGNFDKTLFAETKSFSVHGITLTLIEIFIGLPHNL